MKGLAIYFLIGEEGALRIEVCHNNTTVLIFIGICLSREFFANLSKNDSYEYLEKKEHPYLRLPLQHSP